jgi:multidrug efflux pump subunit AcrA (membrane-fusion protein)
MRRRLSRRQLAVVAAVAVVIVAGAGVAASAMTGGAKPVAAKTTTFAVRSGTVTVTASASGTVQPIDSRALTFGTSGTVSTLNVKAGDRVTDGETLATLDPADAQSAVSSAQSALDAANTNLSLAEEQATETTAPAPSGCVAGAAFVLATPSATPSPSASPSPHPSASASPRPTQSHRPTASASPKTGGSSCGSGSGGRSGTGGSGSAGGSNQDNQGTGTDSLLRAEQAVNNAELTLEQADAKLAGTTIVAPSAGRVLSVAGSVGQAASAGGAGFIVIGGIDSLAVEAQFSEADVAAVAVGQPATVTLADHPGVTYKATVTEVDPAGTASGQLVRYGVQLEFTQPPSDLLLGQSAVAAVVTASAPGVLYVPNAALSNLRGNTATLKVRAVGGDVSRTVTVGLAGDQGTEIKSGLVAGDVVVVPTG